MMVEGELVLRVSIQDGRGFGQSLQALACQATFGDTTLSSAYSVGKEKHTFNATLQWSTSNQQLRRLSNAGQTTCKVTVVKKDGEKLGWVVLDLLKAKLNSQYSKGEGEWMPLSGGKPGEPPPQLRVFHSLAEPPRVPSSNPDALAEQLDSQLKGNRSGTSKPPATAATAAPGPSGQTAQGATTHASASSHQQPAPQGAGNQAPQHSPPNPPASQEQPAAPTAQQGIPAPEGEASYADDFHSGSTRSSASERAASDGAAGATTAGFADSAQAAGSQPPPGETPEQPPEAATSSAVPTGTHAPALVHAPATLTASPAPQGRPASHAPLPPTVPPMAASPQMPSQPRPQTLPTASTPTYASAPTTHSASESVQAHVPPQASPQIPAAAAAAAATAAAAAGAALPGQPPSTLAAVGDAPAPTPQPPRLYAPPATSPRPTPGSSPQFTDGPLRAFSFSLEVRSFQAGRRLPFNTANAYVQASLPAGMLDLVTNSGYKLPTRMTPMRSHPSVDVGRGLEGAIPNGTGTVAFMSGVLYLAKMLARDPRIYVEVWHKEKFRADTLLGVASVPLTPLLHDQWVDGYAPVHALLATLAADGSTLHEEKIQVGMLRVVLSLQDQGPAVPPASSPSPSHAQADPHPTILPPLSPTASQPTGITHTTHTAYSPSANLHPLPVFPGPPIQQQQQQPQQVPEQLSPAVAAAAAAAAAAAQAVTAAPNHHQQPQQPQQQQGISGDDVPPDNHGNTMLQSIPPSQGLLLVPPTQGLPQQAGLPGVDPSGSAYQQYQQAVPQRVNDSNTYLQPHYQQLQYQPNGANGSSSNDNMLPPGDALRGGSEYHTQHSGPYQHHFQQQQQQQPAMAPPESILDLPEYDAAYQLELWKKGEEAKWRAELRQKESVRMSALEGEWRKRERLREAEIAAMRSEYGNLEERARQVLLVAEERERKLVGAEEATIRRRKDMEREHAARMAEAEAAVRRLQVECEHQLEMERDRNTELARQRSSLEERVAIAEARFAALDQAFINYRDQVRNTNEVALQRELLEARDAARRAEDRANRALRAKASYKEQVAKLAEQLARLYKQQAGAWGRGGVDPGPLKMAAQEHTRFTQSQQAEAAALRQQLHALKTAAFAGLSPTHNQPSPPPHNHLPTTSLSPTHNQPAFHPGTGNAASGKAFFKNAQATAINPHSGAGKHDTDTRLAAADTSNRDEGTDAIGGAASGAAADVHPQSDQFGRASARKHMQQLPTTSSLQPTEPLTRPSALLDQDRQQQMDQLQQLDLDQQQQQQHWVQDASTSTLLFPPPPSDGPFGPSVTEPQASCAGNVTDVLATPTRSRPSLATVAEGMQGIQEGGSTFVPHAALIAGGAALGAKGTDASGDAAASSAAALNGAVGGVAAVDVAADRLSSRPVQPYFSPNTLPQGPQPHLGEIKRLLRRKSELIASGAYSRDDPLINRIEQRVMELAGAQ